MTPRLLVCEPHFDQQGLRQSPKLQPSRCPLCPASLWVPHGALFRLTNKATLHFTPSFFFSLYLICRLLGPSLRSLSFQGRAFSKLWTWNAKSFLHLKRFWFCTNSNKGGKNGTSDWKPLECIFSRWAGQLSPVTRASNSRMAKECASSLLKLYYHY